MKWQLSLVSVVVVLIGVGSVYAGDIRLDVYRSKYVFADKILKDYQDQFAVMKSYLTSGKPELKEKASIAKHEVISGIKNMGHVVYVDVEPVIYPGRSEPYFTVDVVDKANKYRLDKFHNKPNHKIKGAEKLTHKMDEYIDVVTKQIMQTHQFPTFKQCPAWHCTFGFDQKNLRQYLPVFDRIAKKHQWKLVNILRNDVDPTHRANAALILAHIDKPRELIDVLMYSVKDPDKRVRNNAMRVIGETLLRSNLSTINLDGIVEAIDFPSETDRNKALNIISIIAMKTRKYDQYIKHHAGEMLVENLRQVQPNIHGIAYRILKLISAKQYGERDYASWQRWLIDAGLNKNKGDMVSGKAVFQE